MGPLCGSSEGHQTNPDILRQAFNKGLNGLLAGLDAIRWHVLRKHAARDIHRQNKGHVVSGEHYPCAWACRPNEAAGDCSQAERGRNMPTVVSSARLSQTDRR